MVSTIDFAIAVGIFFTFIAILIAFLTNYIVGFKGIESTSELRTISYTIYNNLFSSKGVPANWQERTLVPLKVGLITDLYRVPIAITETSNANRTRVGVNFSYVFDSACDKKAWNSTVRLYDSDEKLVDMELYNQTFCVQRFLQSADVALNYTFTGGEKNTFFLYYGPDKNITDSNVSVAFLNSTNFTFRIFSEEQLNVVSAEKLNALRKQNYTDILDTLTEEYFFHLEISEK